MKALQITAYTILGLLLVPPAVFLVFYFAMGGTQADSGHPPAIILPYLYLVLGFRFVGPVGAAVSFWAASIAFSRALPAWTGHRLLVLGAVFAIGCAAAWLHQFV